MVTRICRGPDAPLGLVPPSETQLPLHRPEQAAPPRPLRRKTGDRAGAAAPGLVPDRRPRSRRDRSGPRSLARSIRWSRSYLPVPGRRCRRGQAAQSHLVPAPHLAAVDAYALEPGSGKELVPVFSHYERSPHERAEALGWFHGGASIDPGRAPRFAPAVPECARPRRPPAVSPRPSGPGRGA